MIVVSTIPAAPKIAAVVHASNGHITGDYVVFALTGDEEFARSITCTVPRKLLTCLPHVLRIDHKVGVVADEEDVIVYAVASSIELRIAPFPPNSAAVPAVGFDLDRLHMSRTKLYTTCATRTLAQGIARVHKKRFCLDSDAAADAVLHATAMARAKTLCARGWRMDDLVMGRRAWVVATWQHMSVTPFNVRLIVDGKLDAASPATFPQCPICFESFSPGDVVVNLPCNHNFHVCMGGGGVDGEEGKEREKKQGGGGGGGGGGVCGGVHSWLSRGNVGCPCCRKHLVGVPPPHPQAGGGAAPRPPP